MLFNFIYLLFIICILSSSEYNYVRSVEEGRKSNNFKVSNKINEDYHKDFIYLKNTYTYTEILYNYDSNYAFSSYNSSLIINNVILNSKNNKIIQSYNNSNFKLQNSFIVWNGSFSEPFIDTNGIVILDDVNLVFDSKYSCVFNTFINGREGEELYFINMNMNSLIHEGLSTILYGGDIERVEIDNCMFSNITWKNEKRHKEFTYISNNNNNNNNALCLFLVTESCNIVGCESPYYGCITSPSSLSSFTVNSSFIHCFDRRNAERQFFGSESHKMFNSTIEDINGKGHGGALCFYGTASADIDSCIFSKCKCIEGEFGAEGRGGAIYAESGSFVCKKSNFTNCHAVDGDNFITLFYGTQRQVEDCVFDTANCEKYGGIGLQTNPCDYVITDCTFKNGYSSKFGGGAGLTLYNISNNCTVSNCLFKDNKAEWQAGAIYFYWHDKKPNFMFKFLQFDNDLSVDTNGHDICFHTNFYINNRSWYNQSNFYMCVSNKLDRSVIQCKNLNNEERCNETSGSLGYTKNSPSSTLYVDGNNGGDDEGCGSENGKKCRTLNFAFSQMHTTINNNTIYITEDGAKSDTVLNVNSLTSHVKASSIPSSEEGRPEIYIKKGGDNYNSLVYITSGQLDMENVCVYVRESDSETYKYVVCEINNGNALLSLTSCTVKGGDSVPSSSSSPKRTQSVIFIRNGTLALNKVNFKNFILENEFLLKTWNVLAMDKAFNMIDTSFTNIIRSTGKGSIIQIYLSENNTLTLNRITFSNCQCLNGNGGAINIDVGNKGTLTIGNDTDSTSTFTGCCSKNGTNNGRGGAIFVNFTSGGIVNLNNIIFGDGGENGDKNSADEGNNLFLVAEGIELNTVVNKSTFGYLVYEVGIEGSLGTKNKDLSSAEPLGFIIWDDPLSRYVNGNLSESDIKYTDSCGYENYPCATLDQAFNSKLIDNKIITIRGELNINGKVDLSSVGFAFGKKEGDNDEVIRIESYCYFDVKKESVFNCIPFIIPSSLDKKEGDERSEIEGLFVISGETITFNDIDIKVANEVIDVNYCLFKVKEGNININNVKFNKGTDNNIGLSSSFIVFDGGSGKIKNFYVENISLTSGNNGGVIKGTFDNDKNLEISNSTFGTCSCKGGCGGGIYIELEGGSFNTSKTITEDNNQMNNCAANGKGEGEGRGGGIYLKIGDNGGPFTIADIDFTGCSGEVGGSNIYVRGKDLRPIINTDSIRITLSNEGSKYKEAMGYDETESEDLIPLWPFLEGTKDPAYVKNDGTNIDNVACGLSSYPCKSITCAGKNHFSGKANINLLEGHIFNESINLDSEDYSITGPGIDKYLDVNAPSSGSEECLINISSITSLSSIMFRLPTSIGVGRICFICVSGSSTSLNNCKISYKGGDGKISYSLIKTSGEGIIKVDRFTFEVESQLVFDSSSMIDISGGSGEIKNARIKNIFGTLENGIISVGDGKSITIESSSFLSNITSRPCSILNLDNKGSITLKEVIVNEECKTNTFEGDGGGLCTSLNDGCKLDIYNSSFNNCTVKGNGGGISVVLNGGSFSLDKAPGVTNSLGAQINDSSAEKNGNEKGNGGGLYISKGEKEGSFYLGDALFTSCSAGNYGSNIYIKWTMLKNIINNNTLKITLNSSQEQFNEAIGFDENGEVDNIPLALFLQTFTNKAYVNGKEGMSIDYDICGFESYPCKTIEKADNIRFSNSNTTTIQIVEEYTLNNGLDYSQKGLSLNGRPSAGSDSSINIDLGDTTFRSDNGLIKIGTSGNINGLILNLPSTLNGYGTFIDGRGSLTMTNILINAVTHVTEINYSFIKATSGSVNINNIEWECSDNTKVSLSCVCFISIGGTVSSTIITGLTLKGIRVNSEGSSEKLGLIKVDKGYSSVYTLNITDCSVDQQYNLESDSSLTLSSSFVCVKLELIMNNVSISNSTESQPNTLSGGGGIYCSMESGNKVEVKNSSLIGCGTVNGNGGGINIISKSGSTVSIGGSTYPNKFDSCTGIKGGGVYMELDTAVTYSLQGGSFDNCVATFGNKYFILSNDLEIVANTLETQEVLSDEEKAEDAGGASYNSPDVYVPLVTYLVNSDNFYIDSEKGVDSNYCGPHINPCKSLQKGIDRLNGNITSIIIDNNLSITDKVYFNVSGLKVTITRSFSVTATGNGCLNISQNSKIEGVSFEITGDLLSSLFVVIDGVLDIENVEFTHTPIATLGSSLIKVDGGDLKINAVSFKQDYTFSITYSLIDIKNGNGDLKGLEISNIKLSNPITGGAIQAVINNGEYLSLEGCIFDGSNSNGGNGGAIYIELGVDNEVSATQKRNTGTIYSDKPNFFISGDTVTTFKNCSTGDATNIVGNGGGIYIKANTESNIIIDKIEFGTETGGSLADSNTALEGSNIFVECVGLDMNGVVNKDSFAFLVNKQISTDEMGVVKQEGTTDVRSFPLKTCFWTVEDTKYVNQNVGDIEKKFIKYCGYPEYQCKTLQQGFDLFENDNVKDITIEGGLSLNSKTDLNDTGYIIRKKMDDDNSAIIIGSNCFFDIQKDSTFLNIPFTIPSSLAMVNGDETTEIESLFIIKGGKLTMNGNLINAGKDVTIINYCIFHVNGGSIDIKGVMFLPETEFEIKKSIIEVEDSSGGVTVNEMKVRNVKKQVGNGAVVEGNMSESEILNITNCEFLSCKVKDDNGYGGALWIHIPSEIYLTLSSITFDGCSGFRGKYYFIEATNLLNLVSRLAGLSGPVLSEDTEDEVAMGIDYDDEGSTIQDLSKYLKTGDGLYVKGGESNEEGCGVLGNPCGDLQTVFAKQTEGGKKVLIIETLSVGSKVDLDSVSYSLSGTDDHGNAGISDLNINDGSFEVKVRSSFDGFSFIIFSLSQSFFSVVDGTLIINNCDFNGSIFRYSLWSVSKGIVSLNSVNIVHELSLTFSENMISVIEGTVSLNNFEICNADSVTISSCSLISVSGGTLNISGFKFLPSANKEITFSLIKIGKGGNGFLSGLSIQNITLSGSLNKKNGGVIDADVDNGNTLSIVSSSFSECCVNNGDGGCIYTVVSGGGRFIVGEEIKEESRGKEGLRDNDLETEEDKTTYFKLCASQIQEGTSRGGALFINALSNTSEIFLLDVAFSKTDGELNSADKGSDIFLEVSGCELRDIVSSSSFSYLIKESISDKATGMKSVALLDSPEYVPLKTCLYEYTTTLHVNSSFNNLIEGFENYCGYKGYECPSLKQAFASITVDENDITIDGELSLNSGLEFQVNLSNVRKGDGDSKITIQDDCSIVVNIPCTFHFIPLYIPYTLTTDKTNGLFYVQSEKLYMKNNSVIVTGDSNILKYSIFKVDGGGLDIEGLTLTPDYQLAVESSLIVITSSVGGVLLKNMQISNVAFEDGRGVVINANIEEEEKISISNCSFISCNATGKDGRGGIAYLKLASANNLESFSITADSTYEAMFGDLCFIENEDLESITLKFTNMSVLDSKSSVNRIVGIESDSSTDIIPLVSYLWENISSVITINEEVRYPKQCGSSNYPCGSLEQAVEKCGDTLLNIMISDNLTTKASVDMNKQGVIILKSGDSSIVASDECSMDVSADTTFTSVPFTVCSNLSKELLIVDGGILTMNSITFSFLSSIQEEQPLLLVYEGLSLIKVENGNLVINTASIVPNSIITVKHSLINIVGGSGSIKGLNVKNIKLEGEEKGVGLNARIKQGMTLTLSSCSFTSCSDDEDTREAIFINLEDSSSKVSVTTCTFLAEDDMKIEGVLVSCLKGDESILKSSWAGDDFNSYDDSKKDLFWVDERTEERPKLSGSLLHFLFAPETIESNNELLFVNGIEGADISTCGWNDIPCATLEKGLDKMETINELQIVRDYKLSERIICPSKEVIIVGSIVGTNGFNNLDITTLADNEAFLINSSSTVFTIKEICLKLDTDGSNTELSSIISILSGDLSLISCTFSPSLLISAISVISPSSSPSSSVSTSLTLNNISCISDSLPLISLIPSNRTTKSLSLTLNISNVNLSSSSSVISSLDINYPLTLTGDISCNSSQSKEGGAIKVSLIDGGSVKISSINALECIASSSSVVGSVGRGGFLYLDTTDGSDSFNFTDFTTSSDKANMATFGNNIYIKGNNLNESVNIESFGFAEDLEVVIDGNDYVGERIFSETSEETIDLLLLILIYNSESIYIDSGDTVYDIAGCGRDWKPCRSLECGRGHLSSEDGGTICIFEEYITGECVIIKDSSFTIRGGEEEKGDEEGKVEDSNVEGESKEFKYTINNPLFDQSFMVSDSESNTILTLEKLIFSIPSSNNNNNEKYKTVIKLESGKVNVGGCSFGVSEGVSIDKNIVVMNGGSVNLSSLTFSSSLSKCPLYLSLSADAETSLNITLNKFECKGCGIVEIENKLKLPTSLSLNLSISDITVKDTDTPIFYFSNIKYPLNLNGSISSSSSSSSSQGGAMMILLKDKGSLTLSSLKAISCEASFHASSDIKGKGGFLYLDISNVNDGGFDLGSPTSFIVENNKAVYGKNLFIYADDLNSATLSSKLTKFNDTITSNSNEYCGEDFINSPSIDLRYILNGAKSNPVYLNNNSSDVIGCGNESLPCKSVSKGISRLETENAKDLKIIVKLEGIEYSSQDVSGVVLESYDENNKAKLLLLSLFSKRSVNKWVWQNTKNFTMKRIDLRGPSSFDEIIKTNEDTDEDICIIHSFTNTTYPSYSYPYLSLFNCSFGNTTEEKVCCIFVKVEGGMLEMSECSCVGFESKCYLFDFKGDKILMEKEKDEEEEGDDKTYMSKYSFYNITALTIENVTFEGGGVMRFKGNIKENSKSNEDLSIGCLLLNSSSFTNIIETKYNGDACVSMTQSEDERNFSITNCSFRQCNSTSKYGGVINEYLNDNGYFCLNDSSISNCQCNITDGRGGFLHLDCSGCSESKNLPFLFSEDSFSRNGAFNGTNLFIVCQNASRQIRKEYFLLTYNNEDKDKGYYGYSVSLDKFENLMDYIDFYRSVEIYVGSKYEDNTDDRCGSSSVVCKSLSTGVTHLKDAEKRKIYVRRSGEVGRNITLENVSVESDDEEGEADLMNEGNYSTVTGNPYVINIVGKVSFQRIDFGFNDYLSNDEVFIYGGGEYTMSIAECELWSEYLLAEPANYSLSCVMFRFEGEGKVSIYNMSLISTFMSKIVFDIGCDTFLMDGMSVNDLKAYGGVIYIKRCSNCTLRNMDIHSVNVRSGSMIKAECDNEDEKVNLRIESSSLEGIRRESSEEMGKEGRERRENDGEQGEVEKEEEGGGEDCNASGVELIGSGIDVVMKYVTFKNCSSFSSIGSVGVFKQSRCNIEGSTFEGILELEDERSGLKEGATGEEANYLCDWNGSMVNIIGGECNMKGTSINNSSIGGLKICEGAKVEINEGAFDENNPQSETYSCARRNLVCEGNSEVNMINLKIKPSEQANSSLWLLDKGCTFEGISNQYKSIFFVPFIYSVINETTTSDPSKIRLIFSGSTFMPCSLKFMITVENKVNESDNELVQMKYDLKVNNDSDAEGEVSSDLITDDWQKEISVKLIYEREGEENEDIEFDTFIIKNSSINPLDDPNNDKETKSDNSFIIYIVLIGIVILIIIILLIVMCCLYVHLRKEKLKKKIKEEEMDDVDLGDDGVDDFKDDDEEEANPAFSSDDILRSNNETSSLETLGSKDNGEGTKTITGLTKNTLALTTFSTSTFTRSDDFPSESMTTKEVESQNNTDEMNNIKEEKTRRGEMKEEGQEEDYYYEEVEEEEEEEEVEGK